MSTCADVVVTGLYVDSQPLVSLVLVIIVSSVGVGQVRDLGEILR